MNKLLFSVVINLSWRFHEILHGKCVKIILKFKDIWSSRIWFRQISFWNLHNIKSLLAHQTHNLCPWHCKKTVRPRPALFTAFFMPIQYTQLWQYTVVSCRNCRVLYLAFNLIWPMFRDCAFNVCLFFLISRDPTHEEEQGINWTKKPLGDLSYFYISKYLNFIIMYVSNYLLINHFFFLNQECFLLFVCNNNFLNSPTCEQFS